MRDGIGRRRIERLAFLLALEPGDACTGHDARPVDVEPNEQAWSDVIAAGLVTRLLPAVAHFLRQPWWTASLAHDFEQRCGRSLANYRYRNASQRRTLIAAVRALNTGGISPVLASGGRELWLAEPAWVCVEEIGAFIPAARFDAAQAILEREGWHAARALDPSGYRHERCFVSSLVPGILVLRDGASHPVVARFLPFAELVRRSALDARDGADAHVMDPPAACLAAVLSHHFRTSRRGAQWLELKRLFEFAVSDRLLGSALSSEHAEVAAILGRWRTAANKTLRHRTSASQNELLGIGARLPLVEAPGGWGVALDDRQSEARVHSSRRRRGWHDSAAWWRT